MQICKSLFLIGILGLLVFPGPGLGARTSWPMATLKPVT